MNLILFIFSVIFVTVIAVDLPEYLRVCSRNDPNIDSCIKDSVEHLKPYLVKGVPEFSIPSLEPLVLNEVITEGTAGIRLTAHDVHAYGASNFIVLKIESHIDTLDFVVDIQLPHLYIDAQYEMDGRVLLLPITGSGKLTGNFTDCIGFVKFNAEIKKKSDGQDYFMIKELTLKITIDKGNLNLDNLFNGDKVIGDVVNNAINANFDAFLKELLPMIDDALAKKFYEIGNGVVEQFTYDQLFPA